MGQGVISSLVVRLITAICLAEVGKDFFLGGGGGVVEIRGRLGFIALSCSFGSV